MTSGTRAAPPALDRARDLVGPALRAAVDLLPAPAIRRIAGYHFGWLDRDGSPVEGRGGKYVRPALTLLAAEAVGGGGADAAAASVPGGVAVELVHNFSLLHDDLMDGDEERHHRATAWKLYGPAQAILAGDAMLALADQVLLAVPGETGRRALTELAGATQELIRGQVEDVSFEDRMDVTVDETLHMVAGKTAALMGAATAIGGLLGGAAEPVVAALRQFGVQVGLAFQLVDDLLGIWGRPEVTGKPVLADLRAHKKSVPVVYALGAAGGSSQRLAALFSAGEWRDDEELALAAKLVEDAGGRDWTRGQAAARLDLAERALGSVELAAGPRAQLLELARFVTDRER